jgi:hypothetical protein
MLGRTHRDLEFARQTNSGCSDDHLANGFCQRARVFDFLVGGAGELVSGDVAPQLPEVWMQCISRRQLAQDRRDIHQPSVELQVGAGIKVAEVLVMGPGNMGEAARLPRRRCRRAPRCSMGVQLRVQAVHQAQRLELILAQLARRAAGYLSAN